MLVPRIQARFQSPRLSGVDRFDERAGRLSVSHCPRSFIIHAWYPPACNILVLTEAHETLNTHHLHFWLRAVVIVVQANTEDTDPTGEGLHLSPQQCFCHKGGIVM